MERRVRDPRRLGRRVIVATWAATILTAVEAVGSLGGMLDAFEMDDDPTATPEAAFGFLFAMLWIVTVIAALAMALRWIYLVSECAYLRSNGRTTRPGWAVASYFVPFVNLVTPYRAMREAWQAGGDPAQSPGRGARDYLPIWWGLWIVWNILFHVGSRLADYGSALTALHLAAAVVSMPLAWIFTRIVRELSEALSGVHVAEVFA